MNSLLSKITSPTFIILSQQLKNNIQDFKTKFESRNILFKPHFKTHQNLLIAQLMYEMGIRHITVSSLKMLEFFADFQWDSITLAFPFNFREIEALNLLSQQNNIHIAVENIETVEFLKSNLLHPIGVYLKVDAGYHRTGVDFSDINLAKSILCAINSSSRMKFKGLLAHFGNTYHAKNKDEVIDVYTHSLCNMNHLRSQLTPQFGSIPISLGDTPSASLVEKFGDIDEFRPGNFVFFDWMQFQIGACKLEQIAAFIACPIVAKHYSRLQIIIHGGAVHFSKESLLINGNSNYGQVIIINHELNIKVIPNCYLSSLSQEHGVVQCDEESFKRYNIGDIMTIIPIHSCLTANLMKESTLFI